MNKPEFPNRPIISVVITCYNQERFIAKAIDSVRNQTYTYWECIIVDDGSSDKSETIIRGYCDQDSRIRLISIPNGGVANARTIGYMASCGEFMQFLDGDDWLLPEKFAKQIDYFKNHPDVDIVYSLCRHYYQEKDYFEEYSHRRIDHNPLSEILFSWDRGVSIPIHTPLFKRSLWNSAFPLYPEDYNARYEDWVFWVRLALKQVHLSLLEEPLVIYRIHRGGFCSNNFLTAHNMLCAAHYIARLLDRPLAEEFVFSTQKFVLDRYVKQTQQKLDAGLVILKLNRKKIGWLKALLKPLREIYRSMFSR